LRAKCALTAEEVLADKRRSTELTDAQRRDAFARLFAQHDRWLFAYLVSLLGNSADAEEVFQEVCVVLWREYETFELGTEFVKWVCVIGITRCIASAGSAPPGRSL
jgi:RNA polymerase sigma-70 factor (ECF subfamily)